MSEDRLSDADFTRIVALIGKETGIRLSPGKRVMVEGRLRRRVRALDLPDLPAYARLLFHADQHANELPHLVDCITTNKTDFFREVNHFNLMRRSLVPALLEVRRRETRPLLKIWSAASSTGAEAYTAAMVLDDMARAGGPERFAILGTDISMSVLRTARRAIYPVDQIDPVPPEFRKRYFMWPRQKRPGHDVRVVPELRRATRFEYLNLMDPSYPFDRDVDMILLRNVLIYFSAQDQAAVIDRLVTHLRPGGYLLIGHSEALPGPVAGLRQIAPSVFQRS